MLRYYAIYKPYGMVSQFTSEDNHPVLGELYKFQKNIYPLGRLDTDSEGLLLLTNDKAVNALLLDPEFQHKRKYLAQVEGIITEEAVKHFSEGVTINIGGHKYHSLPARAKIIPEPKNIPPRNPPIRYRKDIPTSWIEITLVEGKNRQIRKMTASFHHPTLRLIRIAIEQITLGNMKPGEVREIDRDTFYEKLKMGKPKPV